MQFILENEDADWPVGGLHPPGCVGVRGTATSLGLSGLVQRPGSTCLIVVRGGIPTTAHWGLERKAGRIPDQDICVQAETLGSHAGMQRLLRIARCLVPATILIGRERDVRGQPARWFGLRSRTCDTMYYAAILKTMNGRDGPDRRFMLVTRPTQACPQAFYRIAAALSPTHALAWIDSSTPMEELVRIASMPGDADVQARPIQPQGVQGTPALPWTCAVLGQRGWDIPASTGPEEIVL